MILFLNVFITDQALGIYQRGALPASNRLDIFKYSLASLAVIKWSKVYIYCKLDDNYQARAGELDRFIGELFTDPVVHHHRNEYQRQWQAALRPVIEDADPLTWFCCNDDHIFIDYELGLLERVQAAMLRELETRPQVACVPTHWTESLEGKVEAEAQGHPGTPDWFRGVGGNPISIQIVSRAILEHWWFGKDYGGARMNRSDNYPPSPSVDCPEGAMLTPCRELVRHFDGYSHAQVDIHTCPPLFIPEGFFENDIRISYLGAGRKPGWTLVNPMLAAYSTAGPEGADSKGVLEDLPLFWRGRISQVVREQEPDPDLVLRCRNQAVLAMASECAELPVRRLEIAFRWPEGGKEAELAALEAWQAGPWRRTLADRYYAWRRTPNVALHHLIFCNNLGKVLAHDRMTLYAPEPMMLQAASLFAAEGFPEVALELLQKTLEAHPASLEALEALASSARDCRRQDIGERAGARLRELRPGTHPDRSQP